MSSVEEILSKNRQHVVALEALCDTYLALNKGLKCNDRESFVESVKEHFGNLMVSILDDGIVFDLKLFLEAKSLKDNKWL